MRAATEAAGPGMEALEPNTIGTNEFADWCKLMDAVPMLAVNLGTRGRKKRKRWCNPDGKLVCPRGERSY